MASFNSASWIEVGYFCDAGSYGGYPLHHAAKRGLDKTVLLLLSRGGTFATIELPEEICRWKHRTSHFNLFLM
jgi:ankyrin repeat protein